MLFPRTSRVECSECWDPKLPPHENSGWRLSAEFCREFPTKLGGGFKHILFSSLTWGDDPILTNIFQMGWNHKEKYDQLLVVVSLCVCGRNFLRSDSKSLVWKFQGLSNYHDFFRERSKKQSTIKHLYGNWQLNSALNMGGEKTNYDPYM